MNRRDFLSASGSVALAASLPRNARAAPLPSGAAAGASPAAAQQSAAKPSHIKLGTVYRRLDDDHLKALARYSVTHVGGPAPIADKSRLYATVEELETARDTCRRNGLAYEIVTPPFLASSYIDREAHPAIMLADSPERDRDIESMQTMIKNCAAAGIPAIKYNMSILGVLGLGAVASGDAAHARGPCGCGHVLGADRLFSGPRDSRGQRIQGLHGMSSARPWRAAGGLSGRRSRSRDCERTEEIHFNSGEPLSRA